MEQGGGDEIGGGEDLEVPLGVVMALGPVDDGLGGGVPSDLLKGEGVAEKILRKAFTSGVVAGPDPLVPSGVDVEAGVFPV